MTDAPVTDVPGDCLFCGMVAGDVPAEHVADNDTAIAVRDINPVAETHVLVIPRRHVASLHDVTTADAGLLTGTVALAQQVAEQEGVAAGYGVATNVGRAGGQSIFHLHFHVIGGSIVEHLSGRTSGL